MTPSVKSSRWSKIVIRTIIVLVVLGGLGWGTKVVWKQISPGLFGNKRQEKMPTSKVRTATIAEEIVAVGRLRAVFSTELRSEINGRIIKILAVDGQKVKKDQEILRLDQQDFLTATAGNGEEYRGGQTEGPAHPSRLRTPDGS
jgi:multidrug efflux pump subunit AcrA (membrane-fusion protein)